MLEELPRASTPEERLFAAVVGLAIRDACIKPSRVNGVTTMTDDAQSAHRFLWGDASESYLHWLDIDAEQFRKRLSRIMQDDSANRVCGFFPEERRFFRLNKTLWEDTWLTMLKGA